MLNLKYYYLYYILVILFEGCCLYFINDTIKNHCEKNMNQYNILIKKKSLISEEVEYFPIPKKHLDEIHFTDTFGAKRANGLHEGCDIFDVHNEDGRIPIISATDGVIENIGWLYLSGYRIGIRSLHDNYYFYAHLDSFYPNLYKGKKIKAGQLLGFMGSTGEGKEGTKSRFPTHLHFGIYYYEKNIEKAVNSYPFLLQIMEN